jgi:hypothetical protein
MPTKNTSTGGRNVAGEIAYFARALKAPSLAEAVDRLADRARAESWSHGCDEHADWAGVSTTIRKW